MATLTAKFDISESELRAGNTMHVRPMRRSLVFACIMFFLLTGIDAYFHFARCCSHTDFGDQVLARLELGAVLGVGFYLLQRFILIPKVCRKSFRQNPFFFKDIAVEIDERGIRLRGAKTQSDWLWSDLIAYREDAALFLIYPSKTFCHVLPKRIFSTEDLATLAKLLEGRLKRQPSL